MICLGCSQAFSYLASSYRPVTSISPRRAMNVSRPQQRMTPVEKCGNPAASDGNDNGASELDAGYSWGDSSGSGEDRVRPRNWTEPRDSAWTNDGPSRTKLKYERHRLMHSRVPPAHTNIRHEFKFIVRDDKYKFSVHTSSEKSRRWLFRREYFPLRVINLLRVSQKHTCAKLPHSRVRSHPHVSG